MTSESTKTVATHADAEMQETQTAYRPNSISAYDSNGTVAVVDAI